MAVRMSAHIQSVVSELAFEPSPFRVRGYAGSHQFVDTCEAVLVWEPRRAVPVYAIPEADLDAHLLPPSTPDDVPDHLPPLLGPEHFRWHTTPGTAYTLRVAGVSYERAAFRPADPDLASHVLVCFSPFTWREEADVVIGHPKDPFKRIEVHASTRHVVVSFDGVELAESRSPRILAETGLPLRWYLPPHDVHLELLARSESITTCAYKGHAAYFSYEPAGRLGRDLAWTYRRPLPEAEAVRGRISFYNERVDLVVDGTLLERPHTFWSLDSMAT